MTASESEGTVVNEVTEETVQSTNKMDKSHLMRVRNIKLTHKRQSVAAAVSDTPTFKKCNY